MPSGSKLRVAHRGQGPRAFAALNRQRVPAAGIHASAAVMLIGVALNYLVPERVFTMVTSVVTIAAVSCVKCRRSTCKVGRKPTTANQQHE